MAEREELMSLLMKMKESENVGLKLIILHAGHRKLGAGALG